MALGKSRSSPTLAAAYNLRQFSRTSAHGKLGFTRLTTDTSVHLDTVGAQKCRARQAELQEAWRRREEDERGLEAAAKKKAMREQETLRELRRAEKQERAEAIRDKELAKIMARKQEEERIRLANEEAVRKEAEEKERLRQEEEEREWRRRQPTPCPRCSHCMEPGKCPECNGKGYHMAYYLQPKVKTDTWLEFGKKFQGCEGCGGYHYGILGEVKIGTGICWNCNGHGKIWPIIDDRSPKSRALDQALSFVPTSEGDQASQGEASP